ncbi:MAG: MbnP family protein [Spirosomataceae bacterium]
MKTSFLSSTLLALAITFLFIACNKETEIGPNDTNTLALTFENRVGTQPLVLGTTIYKNASGEDFNVTTFNYFVGNIALKTEDGSVLKLTDQYFLIRAADTKTSVVELKNIPAANYTEISFMVGVDSTKSVSEVGQRTGVLDIASYTDDNMYWSWNSGYIFMKLEGTSPVVPLRANGTRKFEMHVGGFGGMTSRVVNNTRMITLPLPTTATVRKNIGPEVHLFTDLAKIFNGTSTIKLAETNSVHSPSAATPIVDNYVKMFSVDHVHNEKD